MFKFPIGVMVESFNKEFKDAIETAAQLGAKGLQMYCTNGKHAPENMNSAKIKEVMDIVKSNGLIFSAICGDLGQGFGDPEKNKLNVEKSKRIMENIQLNGARYIHMCGKR